MKAKHSLTLDKEFIQYCELNKITDIDKLAKETFQKGFNLLKYGDTPVVKKKVVKKVKKKVKEEVKDTKTVNKTNTSPTVKKTIKPRENDLYDE